MEYVYASLLLHSAGKEVNEENIKKVLEAAGVQVDETRIKMLVAALKNVNIDEVIKSAAVGVAAVPTAPVAAAAPQAAGGEEKKEEEEEEEEKQEVSEEELGAGLEGLFF